MAILQKPINQAITTTDWTAVALGAAQRCKAFIVSSRGGNGFKISDTSDGAKYFTVGTNQSLTMDLAAKEGSTLFYAQSVGSNDTLEILIVR